MDEKRGAVEREWEPSEGFLQVKMDTPYKPEPFQLVQKMETVVPLNLLKEFNLSE